MSDDVKVKFSGDATDALDAATKVAQALKDLEKKERDLADAMNDAALKAQMSEEQQQALARAHAKAADEVARMKGQTDDANDSVEQSGIGWMEAGKRIAAAGAVITAAIGTSLAAFHAFSEQTKEIGQTDAFTRMGGDVDALVESLGGMVDTGTAVKIASMGRGLGITGEQMRELATRARDVARVTGETTAEAFDKLTKSLGTGSAEMLSGIIPANTFELALARLAKSTGTSADQMSAHERIAARFGPLMDALGVATVVASGAAGTFGDRYEKANAAMTNLLSNMTDLGARAFVSLTERVVEYTDKMNDVISVVGNFDSALGDLFDRASFVEVMGEWYDKLEAVRELLETPINPTGLWGVFQRFDGWLSDASGGVMGFASAVKQLRDLLGLDAVLDGGGIAEPTWGERPSVGKTILVPKKETPEQAQARKDAEALQVQLADGRRALHSISEQWGDMAAQAAKVPTWGGQMLAWITSLNEQGRIAAEEVVVDKPLPQAVDEYADALAYAEQRRKEDEHAAFESSRAFWKAQDDSAKEAKAALDKQANESLLSFGQSFLGGSFDVAALGDAIGAAAGVPMAGQIADAILDVLGGIVDSIVQTVSAIVGDERFGGALEGAVGAAGTGLAAAAVGAVVGLPALIIGAILSPVIVLLSPVLLGFAALATAAVGVVAAFAGVVAIYAGIPALAVGLPVFAMQLSTSTQSFARFQNAMSVVVDRLVDALEPFWEGMLWVVGIFDVVADVMTPFMTAFAGADGIASLLFETLKLVTVAFATVALGAGYLSNLFVGLAMVIAPLVGLSEEQQERMGAYYVNIGKLQDALQRAQSLTFDEAQRAGEGLAEVAETGEDVADEFGDVADGVSLVNVPSGYKALGAIYDAADAENRGGAGGGARVVDQSVSIVVESWNSSGDVESDVAKLKRLARFGHTGPRGTSRRFGDNKN